MSGTSTQADNETFPLAPAPHTRQQSRGGTVSSSANGGAVPIPHTLDGGRYSLSEDELGRGGVARVVRAFDNKLNVERAIKVINTDDPELSASLKRRLQSEATTMAKLSHPHVLPVHDFGQEDGLVYVVTDIADGGTVMQYMDRVKSVQLAVACKWLIQALSALDAAHRAGVVHRDVKPHNLLLDGYGRVLLCDFGIALIEKAERRTRAGVAMGSFAYMPHEQRSDAARVTAKADIYAAGATLYHMLTGENPVELFSVDRASPRWEKLPPSVRPIIQKACHYNPGERYETAEAMAKDLEHVLDATEHSDMLDPLAPFHGWKSRARRRRPSEPIAWTYFAIGFVLAFGILGGLARAVYVAVVL